MPSQWTQHEIDKGIAFRKRHDGSVVAFEICNECKTAYPREDHKLGYGAGRALCFNCYNIGPAVSVPLASKVFAALTINQGRSASVLAGKIGSRKAEVAEALKQLELDGKAKIENSLWFAVER